MISIKKILTLKDRVQIRKCGEAFYKIARGIDKYDEFYHPVLLSILLNSDLIGNDDKIYIKAKYDADEMESIYYKCLEALGEEVADWDFLDTDGSLDAGERIIFPHYLFLDNIRSPFNIGSIFRSAESFGIKHIYLRDGCGSLSSNRAIKTAKGTIGSVEHSIVDLFSFKTELPVFALETGGIDIDEFNFPQKAIAVLGSEEGGVSRAMLDMCDKSLGRVSIRQYGAKGSLNVSVAAGILMQHWVKY